MSILGILEVKKGVKKMNLTELSKEIHENAKDKGFYNGKRNFGELLMLCVTELADAMQADRKGRDYPNQNLDAYEFDDIDENIFMHVYESCIKDTIPQELAGALIRILDLCAYLEIDIQKFIDLEMRYNKLRPHKHGRKY